MEGQPSTMIPLLDSVGEQLQKMVNDNHGMFVSNGIVECCSAESVLQAGSSGTANKEFHNYILGSTMKQCQGQWHTIVRRVSAVNGLGVVVQEFDNNSQGGMVAQSIGEWKCAGTFESVEQNWTSSKLSELRRMSLDANHDGIPIFGFDKAM
jgi:hypothetical protein